MITNIAKSIGFSDEDIAVLSKAYADMSSCKGWETALSSASDRLFGIQEGSYREPLDGVIQESGIHRYTADMVLLLLCAPHLLDLYRSKGISEEIYHDTLTDLRYKLDECKRVDGICGTSVGYWFVDYYRCKRFALGRLQYETFEFPHKTYKGLIKQGDTVLKCHIPSSGPLRTEDVIASLKKAYAFYPELINNGILPVYCSSWLLYPPTAALYGDGSNLRKFFDMFDTVEQKEDPANREYWRIFNTPYSPEALSQAPEATSMQRAFKKYLSEGRAMGNGQSILLFDGETVLDTKA